MPGRAGAGSLLDMTSRRLVALLCLAAVVLLAATPAGPGLAVLPAPAGALVAASFCPHQDRPGAALPRSGAAPQLPSRAPPLA